jgi:crotonobetainyl-CoA:carnitine CoA-transferase CaiB-like acyl-CoA transferase
MRSREIHVITTENLPLAGVRVLDLTNIVSGPMATSILADQGAEVIKIEQPGIGDLTRYMGPSRGGLASIYTTVNRNKRSVAINLKTVEGRELLYRMVESADVMAQNFRPGVADRMQIGHETMLRLKPDLIYASISGFGDSGPYVEQRVYDVVIQALSGMAGSQTDKDGKPQLIRNIVCDKATAIASAQAISAALFGRERTGKGRHVELSMLDVSVAFVWPDVMSRYTYVGEDFSDEASISDALVPYATSDGNITLLTISHEEFQGLARAIDQPELIEDARFSTLDDLYENFEELQAILVAVAATLTTEGFLARLRAEDVPCAPIVDPGDVHLNEQIRHNGILSETEHPTAGLTRTPNSYAIFDDVRASIRTPAPLLGEHTDEVLKEFGETDESIAALRSREIIG